MDLETRFWAKVERWEGCWVWLAHRDKAGYGRFSLHGRPALAHRVAYELSVGPVPPGLSVMHLCDNPQCVNPDHLRVGTHAENMADMKRKGRCHSRGLPGERNGFAKLTEPQVHAIRERYAAGNTQVAIARDLGVDPTTVGLVVRGKRWTHVATA